MKIIYLHHSGFVVELDKNTFVFDAITYIQPQFLHKGHQNYFFATHSHTDHFSQIIYNYSSDYNGHYILSDDITKRGGKRTTFVKPYDHLTYTDAKGGDVVIDTFGSTDLGVSFLVQAEGKTIFHAGDLNWWDWSTKERPEIDPAAEEADYKAEIAKIKAHCEREGLQIDAAFVPVDSRLGRSATKAAVYFAEALAPKVLTPMHFWDQYDMINDTKNALFGKAVTVCDIHDRNEIIYED